MLKTKNEITWNNNEELYLNNIYLNRLGNIVKTMNQYNGKGDILNSNFFKKYIPYLIEFLVLTNTNFKIKFWNLELKNIEDKLLFTDYIHFLSTYTFDELDDEYINIWNETFVPLTIKEKIDNLNNL